MLEHLLNNTDFWLAAKVLLILWAAVITSRLSRVGVEKYLRAIEESNNYDNTTRLRFVRNAINLTIVLVAGIVITYTIPALRSVAVGISAGAGVLAAFVAFTFQKAFSNIASGIFIIIFKPFRVGDVLTVSTYWGVVEDITLRHTVIKSLENRRVIIPNALISTESITNSTIHDARTCKFVEINISYESDLEKAIQIIKEESLNHPDSLDVRTEEEREEGAEVVIIRVVNLNEIGVMVRAYVWAADPITGFFMQCDLNRTLKTRLQNEGISLAYLPRALIYKQTNA
ncbi:MAG: mechanosensitive ion channel [Bernardetiaceae bacterium]|nr:mechanosensitive ion channel [Bernardetiaceae bacterium]